MGEITAVQPDLAQAYKWYDIAAATHGVCIDRLPPGTNRENNQREINYREAVAKQMKPEEITEAQQLAREWKPLRHVSDVGLLQAPRLWQDRKDKAPSQY